MKKLIEVLFSEFNQTVSVELENVYVDLLKGTFSHGLSLQSIGIVVKSSQLYRSPILNFSLLLPL
jgi:hypothetical protein